MKLFISCSPMLSLHAMATPATYEDLVSHQLRIWRQNRTPWCFAFSARAVLQQAICKVNDCSGIENNIGLQRY